MSKCPNCGYEPPRGRPKKLDDAQVAKLRAKGLTHREIAEKLGVTHGAIRASLERSKR
jgi:transcriptional regulator